MTDIPDGETVEIKGSARLPYILKNTGGVYSCTCPAWRNQSIGIERRTCKHLRKYRGEQAEQERLGSALPARPETSANANTAPPLLLANTWTLENDLSGWWMSEKLDGVRAYWDGKQFLSRQGNLYHAPDWFCECLPSTPLDGELWLDRKAFQRTVSIVRRQDKSEHWREISFLIFDAPTLAQPFEERQAALADIVADCRAKHVQRLAQDQCRDIEHLRQELARIEGLGGEGLMLREPGSRYEVGRSSSLYKVKSFHDAEAQVLEHLAGEGRHRGRLGALAVQLPNGTQFSVGTGFSDAQRNNPPPVGSTITFRYQELSDRGVPRFPSFVRMRTDISNSPVAGSAKKTVKKAASKPDPQEASSTIISNTTKTMTRTFEFNDPKSAKFWEITTDHLICTVRFGKIDTAGQSQSKHFPDNEATQRHAEKLIAEKLRKGYVETK